MTSNSTNKNLIFIIVVLLLTNIAVLAYFLWYKKPAEGKPWGGDRKNGMTEMLQKEVGFDDQQVAQYKQLKDEQSVSIKPMFDEMRKAKDSLFILMSNPMANDSIIAKAAKTIGERQSALDLQTFNHFKKVRALCKVGQEVKYDSAVMRMFRKMGKPQRRTEEKSEKQK
jgi:protein CpxP